MGDDVSWRIKICKKYTGVDFLWKKSDRKTDKQGVEKTVKIGGEY